MSSTISSAAARRAAHRQAHIAHMENDCWLEGKEHTAARAAHRQEHIRHLAEDENAQWEGA